MNGKFLLDTNIIIALFAQDEVIQEYLITVQEVFVPSIVIGELYYGARHSGRVEENINRLDEFVAVNEILDCNVRTAWCYGLIKPLSKICVKKGRLIPENDIWIAAIAVQHGLTLISRDQHFKHIDGLKSEKWS